MSGGLRSARSCRLGRNEIKRVLSSGLIPFKKARNTCLSLSVDCKKHVSYYRQTVLDIAMGMLTGKFGWATHLGSRARQIVVVFGSCEISDETTKVKIEQGYSMSARTKRPSWNAWKVGLKKNSPWSTACPDCSLWQSCLHKTIWTQWSLPEISQHYHLELVWGLRSSWQ